MLQLAYVQWVVPVDFFVTSDEAKLLIWIESDEQEEDLPPPNSVIEHNPFVFADSKVD